MVTAAVIAVITVFLVLLLKPLKGEYAMLVVLAGGMLILRYGVEQILQILQTVETLKGYMPYVSDYMGIFIKMIGISYLCEFTAGLCRDGGCQSLGGQIEIVGKLSILAISTPVLVALFETVERLLA
ncbi:MAG: stage III sporulation protein AD [Lachnospiraceae bacterium]|nr:stage III sporulation protein AD [Lachnospiraceae bacterium]